MLLTILMSACSPVVLTPSVGDIQTAIAQTEAAQPAVSDTVAPATATPKTSPTPFPSQTSTHSAPINATVNAAYVNIRSGPSMLFAVLQTLEQGDTISAQQRTKDNQWVKMVALDEEGAQNSGWMSTLYLTFGKDINGLPVAEFPQEQILYGRVEDSQGNVIPGIGIAVIYRQDGLELRTDVQSDETGRFITFIPEDLKGTLDVQIVGINCESPIMDALCNMSEYFQLDGREFVLLPQTEEVLFLYEKASTTLTGTVLNNKNQPVQNMVVVGIRDDGAESSTRTNADGEFSLPVSEGVWQVFTVILNPRREGESVSVDITNEEPQSISLTTP